MNEHRTPQTKSWTRSPWAVLGAVVAVVLGPAATTASALDQANRAPMHHAVLKAETQQGYIPSDSARRRAVGA
ncbi:hypothetical protein [Streptomyces sp. 4F14]|uniref:hypothetical protein n=1 Tax=Streptomyces sp. 4F14 TaxID=3394380 RepID=UPI003A8C3F0B